MSGHYFLTFIAQSVIDVGHLPTDILLINRTIELSPGTGNEMDRIASTYL